MTLIEFFADEKKWLKGYIGIEGEPRCLAGAAFECYGMHGGAFLELSNAIKTLYPERVPEGDMGVIAPFNDHPDTTIDDIRRVCKFADR